MDIQEFGGDTIVAVWCMERDGVTLYINYDFIVEEDPIDEKLEEGTYLKQMTMSALLIVLEKQNEIL